MAVLPVERPHARAYAGDKVEYLTECIIPGKEDLRPPLLLVFGNPAPQSVCAEMFFAFEGTRQEHRFWRTLKETSLLVFPWDVNEDRKSTPEERNQLRKESLYQLSYESPFRIGLAIFCTMPSGASGPWSGVAGLRRLFGARAFQRICVCESERVNGLIRGFVRAKGAVITFQKDAYLWIRSLASPDYALDEAKTGHLIGTCRCDPRTMLLCCPPTRLMHGPKSRVLLRDFMERIPAGET